MIVLHDGLLRSFLDPFPHKPATFENKQRINTPHDNKIGHGAERVAQGQREDFAVTHSMTTLSLYFLYRNMRSTLKKPHSILHRTSSID